jgi:putative MATE family efflux protein
MDEKQIYVLESMPVKKAVLTLVIPTVLSMLVQIFYNLTDTFFIGKLNDPYQVAAVTITLPMFMMLMSISGIFGNGAASLISRLLGEKEYKKAKEASSISLFCVSLLGLLISIFGTIFIDDLISIMGTSPNTYDFVKDYLLIIIWGSIPTMTNFSISMILRSEGGAKTALIGMLIGTITNVVLDPVFIFGFDQGVRGAAIATVVGNSCALIYYIYYYLKGKSIASPSFKNLVFKAYYFIEIFKIGLPSSISQIMMSVGNTISYSLAVAYADHALAAMGVAQRIISIPIFTFIGIAAGVQPLIGYSYGAENHKRLKSCLNYSLSLAGYLAVLFIIMFVGFSKYSIIVFINDPKVIALGSQIIRVFTFAIPFAGAQMIFMVSLQAMGKALPSLIISLCRQGIIYIPAIILLNRFWQFDGIIWALPMTDIIATMIAFSFFYKVIYKFEHKKA